MHSNLRLDPRQIGLVLPGSNDLRIGEPLALHRLANELEAIPARQILPRGAVHRFLLDRVTFLDGLLVAHVAEPCDLVPVRVVRVGVEGDDAAFLLARTATIRFVESVVAHQLQDVVTAFVGHRIPEEARDLVLLELRLPFVGRADRSLLLKTPFGSALFSTQNLGVRKTLVDSVSPLVARLAVSVEATPTAFIEVVCRLGLLPPTVCAGAFAHSV